MTENILWTDNWTERRLREDLELLELKRDKLLDELSRGASKNLGWLLDKLQEQVTEDSKAVIAIIGPKAGHNCRTWDYFRDDVEAAFGELIPVGPGIEIIRPVETKSEIYLMNNSFDLLWLPNKMVWDFYAIAESETPPQEKIDIYGTVLGRARGGVYIKGM